jgi:cell division protease FtsH
LMTRLAMMFGGRVAEELVFDHMTTGAGDDIEKATELARKMVCEWGMSRELGPMTFGRREEQVFLGRDIAHTKDYSEHTAVEIDREVRRIVDEAYQKARALLTENTPLLHALAERLLEKEVVEGAEVAEMLKAYREGRPLPLVQEPLSANNSPSGETSTAKERPRAATEESRSLPGLQPKPSLA